MNELKTNLPCGRASKENFHWVIYGLDNNKILKKKMIKIVFYRCLCKFVCFSSVFKLSFYFKKIVITRSYTECPIGMVYGRKGSQNFNQ